MKRLAAISTMVLALLVAPSLVKANPDEGQPHMQAALEHLQQARAELQEAMHDKGGHRARALELTENAISEVRKGMEVGGHH